MANAYSAPTFVLDSDTNVAGLTALKGSACAATDNICITVNASGVPATFTQEANLTCAQFGIGFGAINGASGSVGRFIQNDGVVLTLAASTKVYFRTGSTWLANGTLRTIATSTGAADQTATSAHANNRDLNVGGEWWRLMPSLTGWRFDVTAITNTTSVTCTADPRWQYLAVGETVEIRTRADGTLKGTKVISAMSATSLSWASGAVSVTAADAVYKVISATDKVYALSGTTFAFGDGTTSAWNNNGGAIPVGGATIKQPGIVVTSAGTTDIDFASLDTGSGLFAWVGVAMYGVKPSTQWWGSHLYQTNHDSAFADCTFRGLAGSGITIAYGCTATLNNCSGVSSGNYGIYVATGCTITINNCAFVSSGNYGTYIGGGCTVTLNNCSGVSSGSAALYVERGCTVTLNNCAGTSSSNYGIYINYGCTITINNCAFVSSGGQGFYSSTENPNLRLLGCRIVGASAPVNTRSIDGGAIFAYRNAATGDTGTLKWGASDMDIGGRPYGTSIGLSTQNAWVITPACWVPGLAAYGATTVSTTLNGGTVATQYRVSHDYGKTYTAWADVPATITDTPDVIGEYFQVRIAKTDAGVNEPVHSGLSVVTTFAAGWTMPALTPLAKVTSAGSPIGCRFIRGMGLR